MKPIKKDTVIGLEQKFVQILIKISALRGNRICDYPEALRKIIAQLKLKCLLVILVFNQGRECNCFRNTKKFNNRKIKK